MIFSKTHQLILSGDKTQTRRLAKAWENGWQYAGADSLHAVGTGRPSRQKWRVGNTYAVQPGRGKRTIYYKRTKGGLSVWDEESLPTANMPKGVKVLPPIDYIQARIRLTGIRLERLQDISEVDAKKEGCNFTLTVAGEKWITNVDCFEHLWQSIHTAAGTRWQDNPETWVLDFELVERKP